METIRLCIGNFFHIFGSVTEGFSGNFQINNEEINQMKRELATENFPTIGEDRKNLKEDASKVSGDYKKAFETKKAEIFVK